MMTVHDIEAHDEVEAELNTRLTVKVARLSDLLDIGRTRIYELIDDGTFKTKKDGKTTLILMWSVRVWLRSLPDGKAKRAA